MDGDFSYLFRSKVVMLICLGGPVESAEICNGIIYKKEGRQNKTCHLDWTRQDRPTSGVLEQLLSVVSHGSFAFHQHLALFFFQIIVLQRGSDGARGCPSLDCY